MPDHGGIQLLPETRRKIDIKTPGENRWLYAGISVVVLAIAITMGLVFYRGGLEDQLAQLDSDLAKLEEQRDKKVESNLLTLDKQLSLITKLLNNHIFWTKALGKIEALTNSQVQYQTFVGGVDDGKLEVKAITFSYTLLAKQIAAYVSDDSIKDVDLSEVHVRTDGKLEFSIKLTFDKNKFVKEE